tara:strand:+ start:432 stop:599 length:168 start_codon:yes stop_codon:yes gene_type:complete
LRFFFIIYGLSNKENKRLTMLAMKKITAAKLIVLFNLPALLLLASAFEVGNAVFN